MVKRVFDVALSFTGLVFLCPLFGIIALLIKLDSRGPIFYRGLRAGRFGRPFKIFKFRTMIADSDKIGPIGTPEGDPRVTKVGTLLRQHKLDELPQLINVLKGEMSLVGPRPEAFLYFQFYTEEEKKAVLSVCPGITDYGSLRFHDEGKLLDPKEDPVETYIEKIRDEKVKLQLQYIRDQSLWVDLKIISSTVITIITTRLAKRA